MTEELLEQLADSGFVHTARRSTATVRIHGVGPLSDAIERALVTGGVSTRRSRGYRNTDVVRTWNEQLVVLADDVVTDPRLVSDLVRCGLPTFPSASATATVWSVLLSCLVSRVACGAQTSSDPNSTLIGFICPRSYSAAQATRNRR
ncbi:hypothetical protein ACQGAO_08900 [Rhodococcus sp. 1.20]